MKKSGLYRKTIIAILVLQTVAIIVIFAFLYNFISNPYSDFNKNLTRAIKEQTQNLNPLQGHKGDKGDSIKGEDGKDGRDGKDGADGQSVQGRDGTDGITIVGRDGQNARPEQIAAAVSQYLAINPPAQGQTGEKGEQAEFRCNPETAVEEYKYPSDEDWTSTGGACIPLVGEDNEL